ncbi:Hypothetical predicted protein [Paramuricea clavata]|uniref:Uncharacterized protein n=1 Tax=Paramuricea clavata TaxID=317549 RepID=A0A6S7FWF5_PARCT|nr:Hypothetical predicted protein [Paramuricea clavata]
MAENTEFIENALLCDNVNLTGYADTDDDDGHGDVDGDNIDTASDVTTENVNNDDIVDVDENIYSFDGHNGMQDSNIDDESKFEDVEIEEEGLDEKTIQSFLKQLIQLQDQAVKKKKENRLIPCVANFLKLDLDQKSEQITPTIIRHLLHITQLIVRNKLDIKIDHGDRGVLEYITSKDCPKKDIKFTFVENMRIHDANKLNTLMDMLAKNNSRQELLSDAKRSAEEAGLIESRQEVQKSVKNNALTAGNDIINFLRKTENYRKSVGLNQTEEDEGVPDGNKPVPATVGPSGAGHKPGTVASSTEKIEEHFRKNGVKPIPQGIKFADGQLGISYQDMIEDLTHATIRKHNQI